MSALEDLFQAAMAATKDRQQDALDVLRGRAKAIDPTASDPLEPPPERADMKEHTIVPFIAFTLAIILLFVGKVGLMRTKTLRTYSIPEPVIGGFLCAACVGVIYFVFGLRVIFDLPMRDMLLLYCFASIGLRSDIRTLISGGLPLVILTVLATVYILMQNAVGMGVATAYGMEPLTGLMAGSVSLTGGVGTTVAWAPVFVDRLGVQNAGEIGIAANTVGLIAACLIGGPIARALINRHHLRTWTSA